MKTKILVSIIVILLPSDVVKYKFLFVSFSHSVGAIILSAKLAALGLHIQRFKVRAAIIEWNRLNPEKAKRKQSIRRRSEFVPYPLSLVHLDSYMKLKVYVFNSPLLKKLYDEP